MNNWISVKDRLPELQDESYCEVMVIAAAKGCKRSFAAIYERAVVRGKLVERWKYHWDRIYDGPEITHWMPLPEPPKEEV